MKKKLLMIADADIPTTAIIARTLRCLSNDFEVKVIVVAELVIKDLFEKNTIIMISRVCDPSRRFICDILKRYHLNYLYYLDDHFWEINAHPVLAANLMSEGVISTLNDFVKHATLVVAGSVKLKDCIKQLNHNAVSFNTAFDFSMLENVKKQLRSPLIKIIYSGSLFRDLDFEEVSLAIKRIADEYVGMVEFHFHRFIPDELKSTANIKFDENFYEYESYIKKIYSMDFDIGIAPLADNVFNRAKTNLKFREYGACGIAGIYSDIPTYSDSVEHGVTGLLVPQTNDAWYTALKLLIDDELLRKKIKINAYQVAYKEHSLEVVVADWANVLSNFPPSLSRYNSFYYMTYVVLRKIVMIFDVIAYRYRWLVKYGWIYAFKKVMVKILNAK